MMSTQYALCLLIRVHRSTNLLSREHELVALGAQKPKDNAPPNATDNPIEAPVATASTENERSMLGDHDDLGIANGKDPPMDILAGTAASKTLPFHAKISDMMPESKLVQVKEESPSPGGLTEKDADGKSIQRFSEPSKSINSTEKCLGAGASAGEKDNDADRDEEDATKELMRILADPTLIGLSDRAVPTTRQAFKAFKPDSKYTSYSVARVIGTYLVNLKNGKALTKDQSQAVYDVLKSISQIEGLNNVDAKNLDIHRILPGVMGESTQEKPYAFPAPFPELAAMLNERIELNSAFEEDIEIQAAAPAANSAASTDSRTSKKRKLGKSPISQEVPTPTLDRRNPAVRDYLYNVERAGKKGKSWKIIDHKKNRASYKKFGHNGLTIGQCWPLCICMLRDGVHGSTQGGISGTEAGGARSIVISGEFGFAKFKAAVLIKIQVATKIWIMIWETLSFIPVRVLTTTQSQTSRNGLQETKL